MSGICSSVATVINAGNFAIFHSVTFCHIPEMPIAKNRSELLVGLFLFIGLCLMGGLILQFGKFKDRLSGHYEITLVFKDASGVIKGSEVRMGGARIGQVASLPELNERVEVEVRLSISNAIRIPVGSTFQISSATLLGDKLIVVIPADDRTHGLIPPGSRLSGAGPTGLDAIQNNAEIVSRNVLNILKEAEKTLTKVDTAVGDIRSASQQLGDAAGKINNSLLAEKNLARFDNTLANLAATTQQWKTTSEQLGPTLVDARDAFHAIQTAADGAQKTLKSADQAISGLPRALDTFTATTRKAGHALDRMEKGEGLLGALASDNEVAIDAKAFMRNLRQYGILLYRNPSTKPADKKAPNFSGPHR